MTDLTGARVAIISRCARTLFNFRGSLIADVKKAGATVIALGAQGDGFEERLRQQAVDFRHIPVSLNSVDPRSDLRLLWHLTRLFREERTQIVHCFTIKPAIFATIAAWLARVPVRIVTITGLGHAFTTASPMVRTIVCRLYKFALARAHVVFFQNRDDRELFLQLGLVRSEIARLIPGSGVDLQRFSPQPLPVLGGAPPRFLMIARLLKEKGVREYIAAASQVKRAHPGATFTLLGGVDPRNPSSLPAAAVAELRASADIQWIDEVLDVRPHIAAADVVVLPSYREGLPRTLLEGAAMGRALLATDAPGCRDLVIPGQTGLLVKVGDADSLAQALQKFCDNPRQISAMGQAARAFVEAHYELGQVNSICLRAYAEQWAATR